MQQTPKRLPGKTYVEGIASTPDPGYSVLAGVGHGIVATAIKEAVFAGSVKVMTP